MFGHGGIFKTEKVAQSFLAASLHSPVRVMQTASEGGAWGIAVLARYMIEEDSTNLATYLNDFAFKGTESTTIEPTEEEIESFEAYTERFKQGIPLERLAHEQFKTEE